MAKVVVFGTGDIGRLAHYYFTNDSPHEVVAFTVDEAYRTGDEYLGLPLVPFEEVTRSYPPDGHLLFVALSYARMNALRAAKYDEARARGYSLATYVSSRCSYLAQEPPGDNCFILEDNTVQPYVRIGNDVTLWSGNHIGHDSEIGDHCFISSHVVVSGHVRVEPCCFIGVNATLRNGITIGRATLVAAGATIMADTEPESVYVTARAERAKRSSRDVKL
jgi:sugar O-acyltransferase (sialic acid O-acetyltransferase NeuD family)